MPYVVLLHEHNLLSSVCYHHIITSSFILICLQTKPCFTFDHPNRVKSNPDNSRYVHHDFISTTNTCIHGFAGYFTSWLYKDVDISIEPKTSTPGMFSWFPIYFPLKEPMTVRCGDRIGIDLWRRCGDRKVWYEWAVEGERTTTAIHNVCGSAYAINM